MLNKLFGSFSTTSAAVDYSALQVDMHSHLLPGIDDGAETLADSIAMVRELAGLGFRKLITTPHVMVDYYKNDRSRILRKRDELREAVLAEGIDVEIEAAAEYLLDDGFSKLLAQKEVLTFGAENYLLFELSFYNRPAQLESTIFEIVSAGYTPVLAHPARYPYMAPSSRVDAFEELKSLGALMQVNLRSLSGDYGKPVQKTARNLVKAGLVDFLGTDLHREHQLPALKSAAKDKFYQKLAKEGKLKNSRL